MPSGRPSKYLSTYADEVIAFMSQGYSITAFAGEIGVSRETLYAWEREFPEFSDALKRARPKRVLALERQLLGAKDKMQLTSAIFALKNADPNEWREKVEVAQTVTTVPESIDYSSLESDEIATLRDLLEKAKAGKVDAPPVQSPTLSKPNGATRH